MSQAELNQLAETVDKIAAKAAAAAPREHRAGQVDDVALNLFADAGLCRVAAPEAAGGVGADVSYLATILKRAGYHALNVPLLEDHLAAELLAAPGAAAQELMTVSSRGDLFVSRRDGRHVVRGSCRHVPWSRTACLVLALARSERGSMLVALPIAKAGVSAHHNVAGEPRDDLSYDAIEPVATIDSSASVQSFRARLLLYRSLLMLGAGERALDLTIGYVTDRSQFGSALSRRQVVQHYIAEMFAALTAARAACDGALNLVESGAGPAALAAALATRIEADRMASLVARLSHQLHGAIGFTKEHRLHLSTTRLTAWRQDDLSETACALELSRLVAGLGGSWTALTMRRLS